MSKKNTLLRLNARVFIDFFWGGWRGSESRMFDGHQKKGNGEERESLRKSKGIPYSEKFWRIWRFRSEIAKLSPRQI